MKTFVSPRLSSLGKSLGQAAIGIGTLILLAACSTLSDQPVTAAQSAEKAIKKGLDPTVYVDAFPDISRTALENKAYDDVFKVGDVADVVVFDLENLSGSFVVDRAGNIVFPLIKTVKVQGLSTQELQEVLTQKYGEKYLQNPSISVKLEPLEVELGRIVVDGAVEKPGVFELTEVIRLSEAIALGEGLTEDASQSQIYLVRNIDGQRRVRIVDLKNVRRLGAEDPEVIPGDIIFVNESRTRVAFREFLRTLPIINSVLIYGTRR